MNEANQEHPLRWPLQMTSHARHQAGHPNTTCQELLRVPLYIRRHHHRHCPRSLDYQVEVSFLRALHRSNVGELSVCLTKSPTLLTLPRITYHTNTTVIRSFYNDGGSSSNTISSSSSIRTIMTTEA
jgi:hypothetical protein